MSKWGKNNLKWYIMGRSVKGHFQVSTLSLFGFPNTTLHFVSPLLRMCECVSILLIFLFLLSISIPSIINYIEPFITYFTIYISTTLVSIIL